MPTHKQNVTTQRAYTMERYFIRNCIGQVVGNPKGYATYTGAERQATMKSSKTFQAIVNAFDAEAAKMSNFLRFSITRESVAEKPAKVITIVRVETSTGRGMYDSLWFECGLPNDNNHPTVCGDSLYQTNLRKGYPGCTWEPSGHRFGFLDIVMLRRWIYQDDWLVAMGRKGGVLCTYEVPSDSVIIGRTQVTFAFEKATCLSRVPLHSIVE